MWARNTADSVNLSMRSVTFVDLPLNRIRRSHVESWVKKMATEGKAPGTIKLRHRHIRGVLRAAVRDKLIPYDPSEGVVLPRPRRREATMVLPTIEQVRALLIHAEPWFRPFIALAAFCGLSVSTARTRTLDADDDAARVLALLGRGRRSYVSSYGGPHVSGYVPTSSPESAY